MKGFNSALYEDSYVKEGQFSATNYHKYPLAMLLSNAPPKINLIMLEG